MKHHHPLSSSEGAGPTQPRSSPRTATVSQLCSRILPRRGRGLSFHPRDRLWAVARSPGLCPLRQAARTAPLTLLLIRDLLRRAPHVRCGSRCFRIGWQGLLLITHRRHIRPPLADLSIFLEGPLPIGTGRGSVIGNIDTTVGGEVGVGGGGGRCCLLLGDRDALVYLFIHPLYISRVSLPHCVFASGY